MRSAILLVALTLVLAQLVGCDRKGTVSSPSPPESLSPTDLSGYARLEDQTDHSGVLLWLSELDSTAVTDSTGFFSFSQIPAGTWELMAFYPYFEQVSLEIKLPRDSLLPAGSLVLPQQLQFSVEPCSATISISQNTEYGYIVLDMWGCVENVSDQPAVTGYINGPPVLIAVRPAEGTATEACDQMHGRLICLDTCDAGGHTFAPGGVYRYKLYTGLSKSCFPPGQYEVYWAISDQAHYPGWLMSYGERNLSLYRKRELFRPASITLVP